jgi:hypothetical protein
MGSILWNMPKRMRVGQRERVKVRIGDASVVREHLYEGNWQWIAGTVAIPLIGWGLAHTDIGGIHRSSVMVNLSQPANPSLQFHALTGVAALISRPVDGCSVIHKISS